MSIALITGGTRGIGLASAEALAGITLDVTVNVSSALGSLADTSIVVKSVSGTFVDAGGPVRW